MRVTMKATIANKSQQTFTGSEPFDPAGPLELVEPTLIKKKELARRLSVCTRTIDDWSAKRIIPYIKVRSRFYLYDFEAVVAAIKKHYEIEAKPR
jgi:hypothetical protein